MNHDPQGFPRSELDAAPREDNTLGSSTLHELCAEMIRLREKNDRHDHSRGISRDVHSGALLQDSNPGAIR